VPGLILPDGGSRQSGTFPTPPSSMFSLLDEMQQSPPLCGGAYRPKSICRRASSARVFSATALVFSSPDEASTGAKEFHGQSDSFFPSPSRQVSTFQLSMGGRRFRLGEHCIWRFPPWFVPPVPDFVYFSSRAWASPGCRLRRLPSLHFFSRPLSPSRLVKEVNSRLDPARLHLIFSTAPSPGYPAYLVFPPVTEV